MKSKIVITIIIISVIAIFSACSTLVYDKLMYPLKFEDLIIENAKENNLEAKLVASVINVESSFREEVVSPKGAVGLMQVKPSTAEWLLETKMDIFYDKNAKVEELLKNAEFNIKVGCYYLKYLKDKFQNIKTALYAYNAGEGNVNSWLKDKRYSPNGKELTSCPFSETNNYINKINTNLKIYSQKF